MHKPEKKYQIKREEEIGYSDTLQDLIDKIPSGVDFDQVKFAQRTGYYDSVEMYVEFTEEKEHSDEEFEKLTARYEKFIAQQQKKLDKLKKRKTPIWR